MSLRVCDDLFFWCITFKIDEPETENEVRIREAMGLPTPDHELNLWPCRKCGAMVHGGMRSAHRRFHDLIEDLMEGP